METTTTLNGDKVVVTNTTDLATFVAQKQSQLNMLAQQAQRIADQQVKVLADLQALLTPPTA